MYRLVYIINDLLITLINIRFMKKFFIICLFLSTVLFANAQTYSKSDLQKYVAEINLNSPIKTSTGDLILNGTLIENVLYETTVMGNKSSFQELQSNLSIFKDALIKAFAKQVKGKMLVDTKTTYILIWACKDGTFSPFQIIIQPEELRDEM